MLESIFRIIAILPLKVLFCVTVSYAGLKPTLDVKAMGAKGDGITNDYAAIIKAVDILNLNNGGTLYFPEGNYFIKPYHRKDNSVLDIIFKNCKDLRIYGSRAKIIINGDFHRGSERTKNGYLYSKTSAIIPFSFSYCSNVSIEGIEINGGAKSMTRDVGVVETGGHILKFTDCKDVIIKNVKIHHAQSDGIYINNNCSNFFFDRVESSHNGRQGMSIIQLQKAKFLNCKFIGNGDTEGRYGGHDPRAGVDIEPYGTGGKGVADIEFKECEFRNNVGAQFLCTKPSLTRNVYLRDCIISAGSSTSKYQVVLSGKNIRVEQCTIELGKGFLYPVWKEYNGSEIRLVGNTIKSQSSGIIGVSNSPENHLTIENNSLYFIGKKLTSYFPYLQMTNLNFLNNKVYVNSSSIIQTKITSLIQNGKLASGNVFYSELDKVKPKVSYKGMEVVKDNK